MNKVYNILVAEDEEYNFTLVKYIFQKEGHNVLWARNGEEAVKLVLTDSEIDLVLMDIKMPVMDGFEAARLIKEARREIPIMAVTAYAFSEDRKLCLEAGCDEFITKPIDRKELLSLSYKLLEINEY